MMIAVGMLFIDKTIYIINSFIVTFRRTIAEEMLNEANINIDEDENDNIAIHESKPYVINFAL